MTKFFTDFSEYTVDAQPSDFTERWNTGDGSAIVKDTGIPSGGGSPSQALMVVLYSDGLYAISWDDPGTPSSTVEILTLGYHEHTADEHSTLRSYIAGGGAAGSEDAYGSDFDFADTEETGVVKYVNGSYLGELDTADKSLTRNQWIWARVRYDGSCLLGP